MIWHMWVGVLCGVLAAFVLVQLFAYQRRASARRDSEQYDRALVLRGSGRHRDLIDLRFGGSPIGDLGRMWQGLSANELCQYQQASDLLFRPGLDKLAAHAPHLEPLLTMARANALVGLGRYADAAAIVEPLTAGSPHWAIRARIAMERGEGDVVDVLLAEPRFDPVEHIVALVMRSDAHLRRGELEEGAQVAREARLLLMERQGQAEDILLAKCLLMESDALFKSGNGHEALSLADDALTRATTVPGDVSVRAQVHLLRAIIRSSLGERQDAEGELESAGSLVAMCQSPPLVVALIRASGLVALHLGDVVTARRHLDRAITGFERLGAQPAADRLRSRLAVIDG